MSVNPDAGLSPAVRDQLVRLGAVRRPAPLTPDGLDMDGLPPAYRELVAEWAWPEDVEYYGPDEGDDDWEECVAANPDVEAFTDVFLGAWDVTLSPNETFPDRPAFSLFAQFFGPKTKLVDPNRQWLQFGMSGGDAYGLFLDVADPHPADPQVYLVDHELVPQSLWGEEEYPSGLSLSTVLSYLKLRGDGGDGEDEDDADGE